MATEEKVKPYQHRLELLNLQMKVALVRVQQPNEGLCKSG